MTPQTHRQLTPSAHRRFYEHKIAAVKRMCDGLQEWLADFYEPEPPTDGHDHPAHRIASGLYQYLTLDLEVSLGLLKRPSPDELVQASANVEYLESQIALLRQTAQTAPSEMTAMLGGMIPMFENQLRQAIEYRDNLQLSLEETETQA